MNNADIALLRLMRLSSPALPVGAYAYSQGMESAVAAGHVHDRASAGEWIGGLMTHMLGTTDLPVLWQMCKALTAGDIVTFLEWNERLLAMRETCELHFEDTQMGAALKRILVNLGLWPAFGECMPDVSFAGAFAIASHCWDIPAPQLLLGYGWAWLENQVAAATKLVPLGQTDAQAIIEQWHSQIAGCAARACAVVPDDIGFGLPAFAHLSATHETLYTRLFRS